jgi:hypothetical protein
MCAYGYSKHTRLRAPLHQRNIFSAGAGDCSQHGDSTLYLSVAVAYYLNLSVLSLFDFISRFSSPQVRDRFDS